MSDDLISRQVVLDKWENTTSRGRTEFDQVIMMMPPVNPQEPKYCDRNICIKNGYNGIGCDECEVTKSQEPKVGE